MQISIFQLEVPAGGALRALTMVWKLDRVVSEILELHGDGKCTKFPTGKLRSPSSYRSLSDDGTYWEEITNIAFYLYNEGSCSDGFYVGGRVANSYGISLCQEKISTALRSSASTTAMRILWSWMASSSITIGISAIPAGIF